MALELDDTEQLALIWIYNKAEPVYAFGKNDPSIVTIHKLIRKRLVKVAKIIRHPRNRNLHVTCFAITRKGKRYYQRIYPKRP